MKNHIFTMAIFIFYFIFSCYTINTNVTDEKGLKNSAKVKLRDEILQTARDYEGKVLFSRVQVRDKTFKLDCSGTVAAIFYTHGIDLNIHGGGVRNIYKTLKANNLLYHDSPVPGDVVFWDNTYDANEDQTFGNDPLTHVGIIMSVDEDGTVYYLHANYYTSSLTINVMNLKDPHNYRNSDGKIVNDVLFSPLSKTINKPLRLAGELYRDSGNAIDQEIK